MRALIVGLMLSVGLIATATLRVPAQTSLPSKMSIQLPGPTVNFQPGPNVGIVQANCLVCHNADYVYNQANMTRAQWTGEVNKMRAAYKATISDENVPKIVDYLMTQRGKT